MSSLFRCSKLLTLAAVLGVISTAGCTPQETASGGEVNAMSSMQEGSLVHDGQELFGHSEGELVEYWPQHDQLFDVRGGRGPHKIKISPHDPEKHIWVVDDNLHQIHKFTYDGELVLTHGERSVSGRGPNNFSRPTDIAWLPDGTYFISDGYVGTRVAKFDANDNFIMEWGQAPADPANPGPNEFNTVHAIAISANRLIYVSDRAHARIQVFDENGNFQFMFPTGQRGESLPYAIEILQDPTGEEFLWVADGSSNRMLKYDLRGNYVYGWGTPGDDYGHFNGPHSITTDQDGNLYIAEVFAGRVQKFVPRPGADPAKIAGQQLREWELRPIKARTSGPWPTV